MAWRLRTLEKAKQNRSRAVCFLQWDGADGQEPEIRGIDALERYEGLPQKYQGEFLNRMNHWVENGTIPDQWGHSWDEEGFRNCFCFKRRVGGVHQRLYGVTVQDPDDLRFRLVVLCVYDTKNAKATDPKNLRLAQRAVSDDGVREALDDFFQNRQPDGQ